MNSIRIIFLPWRRACAALVLLLCACQPATQARDAARVLATSPEIEQPGTLQYPGLAASPAPTLSSTSIPSSTPVPTLSPTSLPSLTPAPAQGPVQAGKQNAALPALPC